MFFFGVDRSGDPNLIIKMIRNAHLYAFDRNAHLYAFDRNAITKNAIDLDLIPFFTEQFYQRSKRTFSSNQAQPIFLATCMTH
jgi:hypothetical protein